MRLGIHGRGLHGAGKGFHGVGRPLGFQVAHAELTPGMGIRRVFHHQLLQQADGGGKVCLSERLASKGQSIFGFIMGHSGFHKLENSKFENGNSKIGAIPASRVSSFPSHSQSTELKFET